MKTPALSFVFAMIVLSCLALLSVSCNQKGGAGKDVLGIEKVAAANADTCLKCRTTSVKGDSTGNFLTDNNYGDGKNPYYKKEIATIYYTTTFENYNDPKCGSNFCTISVMIQSMVDKAFSFSGNFDYGGKDTTLNAVMVKPTGTTDLGKIFTIRCLATCEPPVVSLNLAGTISYH